MPHRSSGQGVPERDNPYLSRSLAESLKISPPSLLNINSSSSTFTVAAAAGGIPSPTRSPVRPEGEVKDNPGESDPSAFNMDLSSLPRDYLEAYPYPAFVLVVPIPPTGEPDDLDEAPSITQDQHLPFTRSSTSHTRPFTPIWANDKWKNLAHGNDLLQCLDMNGARRFGDWISGARAAKRDRRGSSAAVAVESFIEQGGSTSRRRALQSISANTARDPASTPTPVSPTGPTGGAGPSNHSYPQAPEGFWEPEMPPYEDRSTKSDPMSSSDDATGIGAVDEDHPGPHTITIKLVNPGRVTLELTKSSMPIYHIPKAGAKTTVTTHTFVIITTTPRSALILDSIISSNVDQRMDIPAVVEPIESLEEQAGALDGQIPRKTILPNPSSPVRAISKALPSATSLGPKPSDDLTPSDDTMAGGSPGLQPGRPLIFNRDGTVSRQQSAFPPGAMDPGGKSMDVADLLLTTDWSKTSLGPKDQWPQSLKSAVSLVMQYPHQCCLWWGKDLTLIYNAPYSETIHKHPHLFGMSGPVAWAEIWNQIGPLSELVLSGTPVYKEDDFLLFKQLPHQGSKIFEAYHTWMWVPIVQEDGTYGGLWNATIDTTKKVLAERRLTTVREMGERTSISRTMHEFDSAVMEILAANPRDVPFAALYHVETPSQEKKQLGPAHPTAPAVRSGDQTHSNRLTLRLAGAVGVPEGHASTPAMLSIQMPNRNRDSRAPVGPFAHPITGSPTMSIGSSLSGPPGRSGTPASEDAVKGAVDQWPLKDALISKRLVLVEDCLQLIEGLPIRVWDDLPTSAVVIPIANDSDEGTPSAVLVIGLSIRRPFDEDYESFIHVLRLQLASGLAAVRSYEAERQRIEELAALDRAKSLLFSNVSHELRTPLTLVAGPLDDLLGDLPDGPKKENLVMARRNVRRLTRLVSTLMDVSRLEAGRLKGSFRLVNLGLVTRDLAALFRGAIEKAKLRYIVEADLSPRNVFIDPEHWEKIVFNLIGNALKYTMSGFVHVQVSYGTNEAVMTVKDSGVGIPASDIGLVGERFHRVQSVSRSHEGTGIGLALIKELIKLHGGTLEIESVTAAESRDGSHGSIFRCRIPLGADHLPRDAIENSGSEVVQSAYGKGIVDEAMQWNRDRESSSVDSSSDSGGMSTADSSGKSSRGIDPSTLYFKKEDVIMLVDDSYDTRRYMKSIFAPFCGVVEARDGQEALDLCKKSVPDLIITDVMMPVLDGFGLMNALKQQKQLAMIPVIMLTARGGDEAKVEGLLAGADDYVAKPFNARELIARAHMQLQIGKKRRGLEEAFDHRTAELRVLSEQAPVGIFRSDQDGTTTFANSAWYEMSGYPPGDEPINWGDWVEPEHRSTVAEMWERVFGESPEAMETAEWRFMNGRWVTAKIIRLDIAVGSGLKGILGCVTDITERKINEETQKQRMVEAEQRRVEAEEAKRQQELLIDITSHEIRNPISSLMQISHSYFGRLTNLISLQEQLEMSMVNKTGFNPTKQLLSTIDEDLEALESIYQCGLAQERISNDVLSLGRIQLDMLQVYDVDVDLQKEAQKVISIFQNEARMKRIALSLKIGESIERMGVSSIKTDPVRLGQVVTNLLSNGIRFTSTSEIRRIELRFDLSFDPPAEGTCVMPALPDKAPLLKDDMTVYLYVAVTDTGPGLTPKELDMLFQRFSQVSPKTHTIFGGSGLGLFVCRKITELMGGRIEVTSEHGKGSTFRFFIQSRTTQTQRRIHEREHSGPRPALKKRNTGKDAAAIQAGPKSHVLIVEDNLINQTVLMRQLKHVGLTTEVANNGLEALQKVRKVSATAGSASGKPYDCVIMDLEMPVMDGLTAVKHIRSEEAAGTLASNLVIALTGNARQGQIDEAKAAGMDDVVIKPYRLDDLLQKIENLTRLRAASKVGTASSIPAGSDVEIADS